MSIQFSGELMEPGETDLNLSGDNRMRRWRQAAKVLNASRKFRCTLDLKRENEKSKIMERAQILALTIKAAFSFIEQTNSNKLSMDDFGPFSSFRDVKKCTLKETREAVLAAKDARRFRKWESSSKLINQHEHSREIMAGHEVQSPQSTHVWKNGLPIQPEASAREVYDIPQSYQLATVGTSNSPAGTLPPGFCQSHLQLDRENTTCPLPVNSDVRAAHTLIVSHYVSVDPNSPGYGYEQKAKSAFICESSVHFQEVTSGRDEVRLDIPENYHLNPASTSRSACDGNLSLPPYFSIPGNHLPRTSTSMAASLQPHCSTFLPDSSQYPASALPAASNEMEVESISTSPLPGNQEAVPFNSMLVALNVPLDLNEPNTEVEALPLPVTQATSRYFGIEVNVMLAGLNGATIVNMSSFAPKDPYMKHVFAAAVGIGFFGGLFAILSMRKPKQATIMSKIGIVGTSTAVLVALGTEFGVNVVAIALVCLIFAVVIMLSD